MATLHDKTRKSFHNTKILELKHKITNKQQTVLFYLVHRPPLFFLYNLIEMTNLSD